MFGVAIQAPDARAAIDQIVQAEQAGVDSVWATMFGGGGADMIPIYAAASMRTERVRMGTAIVHTWGRQPLTFAQEAAALHELAPGRFRLGIGSTTAFFVERSYGMSYRKPLLNLREYLVTVRALLNEGTVEFSGEHVSARARLARPAPVPVYAAALRPKSYALCGELSDGAISWMSPLKYLAEIALPTMAEAAAAAGRAAPPLVAHVPMAVNTDRAAVRQLARTQLAMYARVPNYQGMFAMAGYAVDGEYPDDLLDDLVVSGTEGEVAAGLRRWRDAGMGEVLAHPLVDSEDREGSIARAFAAVAAARG